MNLEGEHVFKGPREEVWKMFRDPEVLASALPGAQKFNQLSDSEYEVTMNIRIGPVSGAFAGKLVISNEQPPESCTLTADGRGGPGFAKGVGNIHFTDQGDGTTLLKYNGEMTIGGTLASVGQRMIDSVAKSMIRQGFEVLDKALEARLTAKTTGKEVEVKAPTEAEFAANVAKDVTKSTWNNLPTEAKMFVYIIPMVLVLGLIAYLVSAFSK
jgi:carbon monoxide dehydrogenase subunit G